MIEFSDDHCDQELILRAERFKKSVQSGTTCYFDVNEIEGLADHFIMNAEFNSAFDVVKLGLEIHPDSSDMKWCAAPLFAEQGELERSLELIEEIEYIEANNEELFLLKASILSRLNKHKQSVTCYRKAISLNPEFKDQVYVDLAMELENLNDYAAAIACLKNALKVNPENVPALHELSYCYENIEREDELISFYSSFIDDHPYSTAAWFNLGNVYFKKNQPENSLSAFGFCLAIDEDFTPALFNKANTLIHLKRYSEAIEAFEAMMAVDGVQANLLCYIGECYENMEQPGPAKLHYQHALELDDQCAEALIGLAVLLDLEDRSHESLPLYERALKIEPDCSSWWHMYALAAEDAGFCELAETAFEKTLNLNKHIPEVWEDYARLKATSGDLKKAVDLLTEGYICNEHASELLYRKAYYNSQWDSRSDAEDLLSLAVQRDPEGLRRFLIDCPEAIGSPLMVDFIQSGKFEE